MSNQLTTNLTEILDEKTTKIIPENIKAGVQIFDVMGNYSGGGGGTPRNLVFNTTTPAYVFDFGQFYDFLNANLTPQEKTKLLADTPSGACYWEPTFIIGPHNGTHIEICFDPLGNMGNYMSINLSVGDPTDAGRIVGINDFLSTGGSLSLTGSLTMSSALTQLRGDLVAKLDDNTLIFCCSYHYDTSFASYLSAADNYVIPCSEVTVYFADNTTKTISISNTENYFIYSVPEEYRA